MVNFQESPIHFIFQSNRIRLFFGRQVEVGQLPANFLSDGFAGCKEVLYAQVQYFAAERFGQVQVCPVLKPFDLVILRAFGREQYHGDMTCAFVRFYFLQSV